MSFIAITTPAQIYTLSLHDALPISVAGPEQEEIWGSDAIAAVLRTLDIPFLALNPGASYRGLHDSIDRKSTRLNSSHTVISYAVFCLKKKTASAFSAGGRRGCMVP